MLNAIINEERIPAISAPNIGIVPTTNKITPTGIAKLIGMPTVKLKIVTTKAPKVPEIIETVS